MIRNCCKTWLGMGLVAALAVTLLSWTGASVAQTKGDSTPSASVSTAPDKIAGTVTKIDSKNGVVTLRGDDGQTHEFRGDKETLKDLKVGQKIELSKRADQSR